MASNAIIDILQRESGRFGLDIYHRNFATSPWIQLVDRGPWDDAMGEQISVLTYERNAPDVAEPTWYPVAITDGADGGGSGECLTPAEELILGSTVKTYGLAKRVLKGPKFCVETIRSSFALQEQLEGVIQPMAERVKLEWEVRDRHEYFRVCKHKVVKGAADYNINSSTVTAYQTGTLAPGATLDQGLLDIARAQLIRDGAANSAMGMQDGTPILTLICSMETSRQLILQNDDIRQDIRWAKAAELIKPLGADRTYGGFIHLIDPYPRRFNSAYVEVPVWTKVAATKGYKYDLNSDWTDPTIALYEETFIFDRTVMRQMVPKPITNPHSKFKFDPVSYNGDWALLNILHEDNNPRGQIVFHHGILAAGTKPVHPERGMAILHKRCNPLVKYVTSCTVSEG